jgi:Galactose oxidase, central domain
MAIALAACQPGPSGSPVQTEGLRASAQPTAAPSLTSTVEPSSSPVAVAAWRLTAPIPTARAEHTATLLADGRVLVVGGRAISFDASSNVSDETLASADVFDPRTEAWRPVASLHDARSDHVAVLLHDGRVLVAGGLTPAAKGGTPRTIEIYDPATDAWTRLAAPLPSAIHSATVLADGRVLVIGFAGYGWTSPHRDRQAYAIFDPSSMTWSAVHTTDAILGFHTAILLPDGRVLAAGGAHAVPDGPPNPETMAAVFDVGSLAWTSLAAMPEGHLGYGMGILPDGRVLIADGASDLFDPATGHWAPAAKPTGSWWLPIGTSLADGRYLIVGQQGSSDSRGIAEIYDGSTSSWRDAGAFPVTSSLTVTLLADGRVLVVGGLVTCYAGTGCHNDMLTANAYLFDPRGLP